MKILKDKPTYILRVSITCICDWFEYHQVPKTTLTCGDFDISVFTDKNKKDCFEISASFNVSFTDYAEYLDFQCKEWMRYQQMWLHDIDETIVSHSSLEDLNISAWFWRKVDFEMTTPEVRYV